MRETLSHNQFVTLILMGAHRISRKKFIASDIPPPMSVICALNHVGGQIGTLKKKIKDLEMSYDAINWYFCSTNEYYKTTKLQLRSSPLGH